MKARKLWALTDERCRLFGYLAPIGPVFRDAPKVPIMYWPDGEVCWPVTMWLVSVAKDSPNARGPGRRGNTVATYASLISALVRYVSEKKIAFESLSDDNFYDWVERLKEEPDLRASWSPRRTTAQVRRIVGRALYFLVWYQGHFLQTDKLIGESDDCRITFEHKEGRGKGKYRFSYIVHRAMPQEDVPRDVKPIGHSNISLLYDVIPVSTSDTYVHKRRQNTLRLLEAHWWSPPRTL